MDARRREKRRNVMRALSRLKSRPELWDGKKEVFSSPYILRSGWSFLFSRQSLSHRPRRGKEVRLRSKRSYEVSKTTQSFFTTMIWAEDIPSSIWKDRGKKEIRGRIKRGGRSLWIERKKLLQKLGEGYTYIHTHFSTRRSLWSHSLYFFFALSFCPAIFLIQAPLQSSQN